jgi:glutamate-ammonia-ligase adenylyltransferase
MGRLYQVDMRLRPTGKSGSLVCPLTEFRRYYAEGGAQLWERQSLTRARVVYGDIAFGQEVTDALAEAAYGMEWRREFVDEIREMRNRLESSRSERDLKRSRGGFVDIEFLVQLLQLKYGKDRPGLRTPNTWEGLQALHDLKLVSAADHAALVGSYDFLRRVESRLRIVQNRAMSDLPAAGDEMEKLARRLAYVPRDGESAGNQFQADLKRHMDQAREVFDRLTRRERQ